jgi:uncharacterized cupredoxin-like copper-binding protein
MPAGRSSRMSYHQDVTARRTPGTAVLGLAGLLAAVGCSGDDESGSETTGTQATTIAPADEGGTSGDRGVGATASTTIDVSLTEFSIDGNLTAPAGNVVLNVTNDGTMEHNLVRRVPLLRTPNLDPGATTVMELGELSAGTYEIYCDISGHQTAGMVATLVVTDGEGGEGGSAPPQEEEPDDS